MQGGTSSISISASFLHQKMAWDGLAWNVKVSVSYFIMQVSAVSNCLFVNSISFKVEAIPTTSWWCHFASIKSWKMSSASSAWSAATSTFQIFDKTSSNRSWIGFSSLMISVTSFPAILSSSIGNVSIYKDKQGQVPIVNMSIHWDRSSYLGQDQVHYRRRLLGFLGHMFLLFTKPVSFDAISLSFHQ